MASWGNQGNGGAGSQENQQMESPNGYHLKVTDANENGPALYAKNTNGGASARALKAEGTAEIVGDLTVSGTINGANVGDDAIVGDNSNETHIGQLDHPTKVLGNLQVTQPLVVGAGGANGIGNIEAQGTTQVPRPLEIGTGRVAATTSSITISRADQQTTVNGALGVGQGLDVDGATTLEATTVGGALTVNDALTVNAGAEQVSINTTGGVHVNNGSLHVISDANGEGFADLGTLGVQNPQPRLSFLGATPANGGARVDAFMDDAGGHPDESTLHLNCDEGTFDVILSHRDFGVPGNHSTVRVESPRFRVGFPGNQGNPAQIGLIDGNGTLAAPLDIQLGTGFESANTEIGRSGQAVKIHTATRFGNGAGTAARLDAELDGAASRNIEIGGQNTSADIILGRAGQDVIAQEDLAVRGILTVGPNNNVGQIDANNAHDLKVGTQNATTDVEVGRSGQKVKAVGDIVAGTAGAGGKIDSAGADLKIGSVNTTNDVYLGRTGKDVIAQDDMGVRGNLTVGPSNAVGKVDSGGSAGTPRGLSLGTTNVTSTVVVGRAGQTTQIDSGTVTVGGTLDLNADAYIGTTASAGQIDSGGAVGVTTDLKIGTQNVTKDVLLGRSGQAVKAMTDLTVGVAAVVGKVDSNGTGAAPQDIAVGTTNVTANVQLSRAGQTIDMFGTERLNSNEVVVNGVANLANAASAGFVYNSVGHGNGKSIDFYIDGARRGYIDVTGWH